MAKTDDATTVADPEKKVRKARGTAKKKKFLLYTAEGNELTFVCEAEGLSGPIAVTNATKAGTIAPGTPIVPIAPVVLTRTVEIEAEERNIRYRVKPKTKARRVSKKAAPTPDAPDASTDATPPTPEEAAATGNPFAPSE